MQYAYKKLKGRIVEKYDSQAKFAEVLGISKQAMSKKMTGITGFSQKDIERWADLLEIPVEQYSEYFFA